MNKETFERMKKVLNWRDELVRLIDRYEYGKFYETETSNITVSTALAGNFPVVVNRKLLYQFLQYQRDLFTAELKELGFEEPPK